MKEKEIVKEHEKITAYGREAARTGAVSRGFDGRKVAKTRRENLDKCVASYYLRSDSMTLSDLYTEWIVYKEIEPRTSSYIAKIKSDWRTYYKKAPVFASKKICDLGPIDVKAWANGMIKKYDMDRKTYYNTSLIA